MLSSDAIFASCASFSARRAQFSAVVVGLGVGTSIGVSSLHEYGQRWRKVNLPVVSDMVGWLLWLGKRTVVGDASRAVHRTV
jgi:hypothetical protein